jgi:hypothetical protein
VQLLAATLKGLASESVTYRRGNDTIDGLLATPVRTSPEDYSLDADISVSAIDRDWIVAVGDLAFAGQLTEPQTGDAIDFRDSNGVLRTYRVCPRTKATGGRCFRHDLTKQLLRIFTTEKKATTE